MSQQETTIRMCIEGAKRKAIEPDEFDEALAWLDDLKKRLAAANNIVLGASAAVDASLLALHGTSDGMATEARTRCNQFKERVQVYIKTGR